MSTSASSRWIDARLSDALAEAFDQISQYVREGGCTEAEVRHALLLGWGEEVADGWDEWVEEGS